MPNQLTVYTDLLRRATLTVYPNGTAVYQDDHGVRGVQEWELKGNVLSIRLRPTVETVIMTITTVIE